MQIRQNPTAGILPLFAQNKGLTNNPTAGYAKSMNKKTLSEVMRFLGSQKSSAKAKAARINGRKGGRPKGSKNR